MPSADFWVGPPARPDTYRLVTLLGGGGEGEVWQAVLPLSAGGRSTVAVKILRAGLEPDAPQRWERFGHLLRSLSHPGLVRVTDVFTGPLMHRETGADPASRASYVVMDYIEGPTLREWCDEHPDATASQRLRMLRMVASALDEMHSGASTQVPVAHGDVKPANVVVREDGGTVLVDLGLARLTDDAGVSGRSTPYAAPEMRAPSAMATPEADRYSFAVTAAQVLTGQPPPTGPDGWLDQPALESLLRANPITARRPLLVRQVLDAITAPPEARPRQLRIWLDSAADTLSQVTTNGDDQQPTQQLTAQPAAVAETGHHTDVIDAPTVVIPTAPTRRKRWPLAAAAAVVILLAAGLTAYVLRPDTAGAQDQPSTAQSTTLAPTATTTPPPTADANDTTSASPTGTTGLPTAAAYLSSMTPVDRDIHTGDNGGYQNTPYSTNGIKYGHAIGLRSFCSNRDGGDYWNDYDLARSWNTFTATIGLADDSQATSTANYTILGDGKTLTTGTLKLGMATPINLPVTGILRLRLHINEPSAIAKPCISSANAVVVWGDPTLTP